MNQKSGGEADDPSEISNLDESWPMSVKVALFAAVGMTAVGIVFAAATFLTHSSWDERGTVGDFFGGHLAGFGNLASFFVVFAALILQTRELAMQRHALVLQRDEMKEQRAELAAQTVQLERTAANQDRAASALERAATAWERASSAQEAVAKANRENIAFERKQAERRSLADRYAQALGLWADADRRCREWRMLVGKAEQHQKREDLKLMLDDLAAVDAFDQAHMAALAEARDLLDRCLTAIRDEPLDVERFDRRQARRAEEVVERAGLAFAEVRARLDLWQSSSR